MKPGFETMAQLTIQVNGKPYVVGCDDGQEAHLMALAAIIDAKVREADPGGGQLGETRLMLMATLELADELGGAKAGLAAAQAEAARLGAELEGADAKAVAALEAAAQKIEAMATR
jgi:cell division protein ZapA